MLREKARPVNDADAAILETIEQSDITALASIRSQVSPTLVSFLEQLLQKEEGSETNWLQLVETLRAAGLTAAALAGLTRVNDLSRNTRNSDPSYRITALEGMAEMETQLNMRWAAAADQRAANRLRGLNNPGGVLLELDEGDLAVQAAHNDPEGYARLVESLTTSPLLDDPLREPFLTKRMAQVASPGAPGVDDCSFFVMDGEGHPILQVEADARGDRYLGCHETALILTRLEPSHPQMAMAESLAVRQLQLILEWCGGCDHVRIEVSPADFKIPPLRAWILDGNGRFFNYTAAWIDLSVSEEEIEKAYRTAHRQSLRWGRQHIRIEKTSTADPVMLDRYEQVYAASLRVPGMSAEVLAAYLAEGYFNLYIGYFEDEPAVALLSSRHGSTTYYCASAKKIIGNKPTGHVVLHQAIIDAKAEGQTRFDFGPLYEEEGFSSKLRSIALYKRGFANRTEVKTVYMCKRS